jgi:alpha-L-fucosidase 2
LVQCPDVPGLSTPLIVTLLPALPSKWASGKIMGVFLRGGITIDLEWRGGKATEVTLRVGKNAKVRPVQVMYGGKVVSMFTMAGEWSNTINL